MKFAEKTAVPVSRTRIEIENLLHKYGANQFASGWIGDNASIAFVAHGRMVRFVLPIPTEDDVARKKTWNDTSDTGRVKKYIDEETMRRWRCLLLAIKAKLESVSTGISSFDEEFLAHIVVDNMTIYERLKMIKVNGTLLLAAPDGA
jgi:hypothetical protein